MSHGGPRKKAGRPFGRGPWQEKTKPIRIPLSLLDDVKAFLKMRGYRIPLYSSRIPAGTPTAPVDDVEEIIDLNSLLLKNPESSYLLQVSGDSMIDAGIFHGDLLIVDRSIEAVNGHIVAAMVDGEVTVKRLKKDKAGNIVLWPENKNYAPIVISKNQQFEISGVVSDVIHRL